MINFKQHETFSCIKHFFNLDRIIEYLLVDSDADFQAIKYIVRNKYSFCLVNIKRLVLGLKGVLRALGNGLQCLKCSLFKQIRF